MTEYFKDKGRQLLTDGDLIIPIKVGSKAPDIKHDWPKARLTTYDLDQHPGCGIGILCGQGVNPILGVDIDTLNAELNAAFVQWCYDNLGYTCARVGKAPKILLPYRGETKLINSRMFEGKQRLQILGTGQQFVAYHVHPDTGEPYEWVDLLGGIEDTHVSDLPLISKEQVETAIAVFEKLAVEHGLKPI